MTDLDQYTNPILFSTNHIQYIFLFKTKVAILDVCYDIISDQLLFETYHEIYYQHISKVTTSPVILETPLAELPNLLAKEFTFKTLDGSDLSITVFDEDDFIQKIQATEYNLKIQELKQHEAGESEDLEIRCMDFGIHLDKDICTSTIEYWENQKRNIFISKFFSYIIASGFSLILYLQ